MAASMPAAHASCWRRQTSAQADRPSETQWDLGLMHQASSPVRRTGDRSLWWSSVCTADQLWAPCASQSAWCDNTAGPAPGSAPPSPEDPPPDGARRISTGQRNIMKQWPRKKKRSPALTVFFSLSCSFLIFVATHLDVKGRLRGEVSEGAGNHHSGTLVTKNTHQASLKHTQKHARVTITTRNEQQGKHTGLPHGQREGCPPLHSRERIGGATGVRDQVLGLVIHAGLTATVQLWCVEVSNRVGE